MDEGARQRVEAEVLSLCRANDFAAAATVAIKQYGPEIFGFLVAFHHNEQDAADVFSIFSEKLWQGLSSFRWQSSLRTWAYTIARNSSIRHKEQAKRGAVRVGLSDASVASKLAAQVRTATASYLKTEKKDRFVELRESLSEEEKALLILRVDRGLAWDEIARVMGGAEASDETIKRDSARLRKRFQLITEKLFTLGKRAGLIKRKD